MKSNRRSANGLAATLSPSGRGRTLRRRSGWSLFLDKTVPLHVKVLALTLGGCATFLLVALEVPLEGVLAVALPFLGVPLDFAVDGLEVFVLPVLFGALILPSLVKARR